jgi:hypothetical protein
MHRRRNFREDNKYGATAAHDHRRRRGSAGECHRRWDPVPAAIAIGRIYPPMHRARDHPYTQGNDNFTLPLTAELWGMSARTRDLGLDLEGRATMKENGPDVLLVWAISVSRLP